MPSYARVFTPRYRVKYRSAGIEHHFLVRSPRDTATATVISSGQACIGSFCSALADKLADDFLFISAEVCEQDVDTFVPAPTPGAVAGTVDWATVGWSPVKRCHALTFYGRAVSSHARISIYGLDISSDLTTDLGANGVVTTTEWAAITTAAAVLNDHARAGSGAPANFYTQATWKLNDRLLKSVRRGLF